MKRRLLPLYSLAFIGLLLSSCQPFTAALYPTQTAFLTDTPAPTQMPYSTYTVYPSPTPYPTYTLNPTYTVLPTDTGYPTSTNTLTVEAPPTITLVIPDGWRQYEHPTSEFSLWHPADWKVEDESISGVVFRLPNRGSSLLGLVNEPPRFKVGEEESINQLIRQIILFKDEYKIEIVAKGAWSNPRANFVESMATKNGFRWHEIQVRMPVDANRFIVANLARTDNVSDAEIQSWKILLASLKVHPGMKTVAVSPTATPTTTTTPVPGGLQVDIPEWNWFLSASGNYVKVQGTVQNISDKSMRFVEIHVIFRDKDENFLGTDSGFAEADVLSPGSLTTWSISTRKMGDVRYVELSQILWKWVD